MSGVSPRLEIPYLTGSDPWSDVDNVTFDAASRLDDLLAGPTAAGEVLCDIVNANTDYSVVVAFPVGRFDPTDVISVVCTPKISTLGNFPAWGVGAITSTGFTLYFRRGSTTDFTMQWIASCER